MRHRCQRRTSRTDRWTCPWNYGQVQRTCPSFCPIITFRVSRRRREMYCGHARVSVCLSISLSVRGRMPTLLHRPGIPDVTWGVMGMPPSCALLGRFAVGARVALLWQQQKCVAEPSGNLPGPPHATCTMHAGEDSPRQR